MNFVSKTCVCVREREREREKERERERERDWQNLAGKFQPCCQRWDHSPKGGLQSWFQLTSSTPSKDICHAFLGLLFTIFLHCLYILVHKSEEVGFLSTKACYLFSVFIDLIKVLSTLAFVPIFSLPLNIQFTIFMLATNSTNGLITKKVFIINLIKMLTDYLYFSNYFQKFFQKANKKLRLVRKPHHLAREEDQSTVYIGGGNKVRTSDVYSEISSELLLSVK